MYQLVIIPTKQCINTFWVLENFMRIQFEKLMYIWTSLTPFMPLYRSIKQEHKGDWIYDFGEFIRYGVVF